MHPTKNVQKSTETAVIDPLQGWKRNNNSKIDDLFVNIFALDHDYQTLHRFFAHDLLFQFVGCFDGIIFFFYCNPFAHRTFHSADDQYNAGKKWMRWRASHILTTRGDCSIYVCDVCAGVLVVDSVELARVFKFSFAVPLHSLRWYYNIFFTFLLFFSAVSFKFERRRAFNPSDGDSGKFYPYD